MIALTNPRTGETDAHIEATGAGTLDTICAELREHQIAFAALSFAERAAAVRQLAEHLENNSELLSALIQDTGRVAISHLEVKAVAQSARRWAQFADDFPNQLSGQTALPTVQFETYGVPYPLVGVISPWNFPLLLAMIDTLPALLAGCAVWIKPSEVAARFVYPLNRIVASVPVLAHVLRFIEGGADTGAAMIARSDALCFTGSVATGRKVYRACAEHFIPAFLELGGKDPLVILPDSDLDQASTIALRASVIATGQACQSIERIYVSEAQFDAFLAMLTDKANALVLSTELGRGHIGPLIFPKQAQTIMAQLEQAQNAGAVIHCGGRLERHGGGSWIRPTVLSHVNHSMAVMRDETFGPIMPVMAYRDLAQATALANDSEYGLSAAVVGPDLAQAIGFAKTLKVGAVSINDAALTSVVYDAEKQAFGNSGMGASRMGSSGLSRFLRKKSLLIQRGQALPLSMLEERLL
jgi:succinate-semialdehyde dehydrogenase / glutarate-semialdehyde dehydrogenase